MEYRCRFPVRIARCMMSFIWTTMRHCDGHQEDQARFPWKPWLGNLWGDAPSSVPGSFVRTLKALSSGRERSPGLWECDGQNTSLNLILNLEEQDFLINDYSDVLSCPMLKGLGDWDFISVVITLTLHSNHSNNYAHSRRVPFGQVSRNFSWRKKTPFSRWANFAKKGVCSVASILFHLIFSTLTWLRPRLLQSTYSTGIKMGSYQGQTTDRRMKPEAKILQWKSCRQEYGDRSQSSSIIRTMLLSAFWKYHQARGQVQRRLEPLRQRSLTTGD